jgi:hypothetical protein
MAIPNPQQIYKLSYRAIEQQYHPRNTKQFLKSCSKDWYTLYCCKLQHEIIRVQAYLCRKLVEPFHVTHSCSVLFVLFLSSTRCIYNLQLMSQFVKLIYIPSKPPQRKDMPQRRQLHTIPPADDYTGCHSAREDKQIHECNNIKIYCVTMHKVEASNCIVSQCIR